MQITIAKVLLQANGTAWTIHIHILCYYQCYSNFILQHYVVYKSTQIGLGQKIVGKQLTTLNFQLTFQLTIFENQLPTKSLTGLFQLKIVKSLTTFFQFSAHHWQSQWRNFQLELTGAHSVGMLFRGSDNHGWGQL